MSFADEIMAKAERVKEVALEAMEEENDEHRDDEALAVAQSMAMPSTPPYTGLDKLINLTRIEPLFVWLCARDPFQIQCKRTALSHARSTFDYMPVEDVHAMGVEVADGWHADAAESFREKFIGRLATAHRIQTKLVDELNAGLNASEQLLWDGKKDLMSIADDAITALEAIRDQNDYEDKSLGFAVLGAMVGIAAAACPPSGAVTFALLSGGVSVMGSAVEEGGSSETKDADSRVTGSTTDDVLDSLVKAVEESRDAFDKAEEKIVQNLKNDIGALSANEHLLAPEKPMVIDHPKQFQPNRR